MESGYLKPEFGFPAPDLLKQSRYKNTFKTEQQISVDVNKCINKHTNPKAAVSKAAAAGGVIVVCGFSST